MSTLLDPIVLNDWFVVSAVSKVKPGERRFTQLLGGGHRVFGGMPMAACMLPTKQPASKMATSTKIVERYGFVWVSLGNPQKDLYALPEFTQSGRRFIDCGTFGVKTSGLRIIENFLDMGHFPFVHTDILGQEPHTEVREYKVETDPDTGEIWAKECSFWQPKAAASATDGLHVDYTYRVMQPFFGRALQDLSFAAGRAGCDRRLCAAGQRG
ncbi:hypothetical protein ACFS07_01965 [Undibacterium arcticum]